VAHVIGALVSQQNIALHTSCMPSCIMMACLIGLIGTQGPIHPHDVCSGTFLSEQNQNMCELWPTMTLSPVQTTTDREHRDRDVVLEHHNLTFVKASRISPVSCPFFFILPTHHLQGQNVYLLPFISHSLPGAKVTSGQNAMIRYLYKCEAEP